MTLANEVAEVGVKVHEFEKARDDRGIAKCAAASCIVEGERGGCYETAGSTQHVLCRSTSTMDYKVRLFIERKW